MSHGEGVMEQLVAGAIASGISATYMRLLRCWAAASGEACQCIPAYGTLEAWRASSVERPRGVGCKAP